MKGTKMMLGILATLAATFFFFGLIGYILTDYSFKESYQQPGLYFAMIVIGWLPAVIVGKDLDEVLS